MRGSIIVPSCERSVAVKRTVGAVLSTDPRGHDTEVVVVDNNSDSRLSMDLRTFCHSIGDPVRYVAEPSPGVAAARHRGAREAQGDILLFIDDDVEVSPGWLKAVLERFRDGGVSIVGGPSVPRFTGSIPAWLWDFVRPRPLGGWSCSWISLLDIGKSVDDIDPNQVWTLNLSIRRELFVQVGGQHPCYVPPTFQRWQGDGELGLTMKVKALGARAAYVNEALVHHLIDSERLTGEYFARRAFYQGVCDSFTEIRAGAQPSSSRCEGSAGLASAPAAPWAEVAREVRAQVAAGYEEGWAFHQREAAHDPLLLAWIRRDNFWDVDIRDQARLRESAHG